jgi:hypothetical protein
MRKILNELADYNSWVFDVNDTFKISVVKSASLGSDDIYLSMRLRRNWFQVCRNNWLIIWSTNISWQQSRLPINVASIIQFDIASLNVRLTSLTELISFCMRVCNKRSLLMQWANVCKCSEFVTSHSYSHTLPTIKNKLQRWFSNHFQSLTWIEFYLNQAIPIQACTYPHLRDSGPFPWLRAL